MQVIKSYVCKADNRTECRHKTESAANRLRVDYIIEYENEQYKGYTLIPVNDIVW